MDQDFWNWRDDGHRYNQERCLSDPKYIGSYAMDAVAMAMHCVYTTSTFAEATLKAANMRGDSDSVGAVVGQLAGALYGVTSVPEAWLCRLQQWDGGGTIAARAGLLYRHAILKGEPDLRLALQLEPLSDIACKTALPSQGPQRRRCVVQ